MLTTYLPYLTLFSVLLAVYALFRKESREDGQTTAQRLQKMEAELRKQDIRQQGFQAEIEGVADHGKRERQTLEASIKRDHDTLREQIKDMPDMRQLLARMDERFLNTKEEMKSLALKMDRIVELLTHK